MSTLRNVKPTHKLVEPLALHGALVRAKVPEPDGAVVTGRNEDVAGQLSNEIGISSFTAPLTTRLPIVTLELKNVWTNI